MRGTQNPDSRRPLVAALATLSTNHTDGARSKQGGKSQKWSRARLFHRRQGYPLSRPSCIAPHVPAVVVVQSPSRRKICSTDASPVPSLHQTLPPVPWLRKTLLYCKVEPPLVLAPDFSTLPMSHFVRSDRPRETCLVLFSPSLPTSPPPPRNKVNAGTALPTLLPKQGQAVVAEHFYRDYINTFDAQKVNNQSLEGCPLVVARQLTMFLCFRPVSNSEMAKSWLVCGNCLDFFY